MMLNLESLSGKCLIAMPSLKDENFAGTLIYLCSHNKNGAMGFIVNKKLYELSFSDLMRHISLNRKGPYAEINIYCGGPLEKIRGFVLHSTDYIREGTVVIDKNMAVSSSLDILNDIAGGSGPVDNLIALGYANWISGQLEQEISDGSWLITEPSDELIFHTRDEEKWSRAMDELGVNPLYLSSRVGRA